MGYMENNDGNNAAANQSFLDEIISAIMSGGTATYIAAITSLLLICCFVMICFMHCKRKKRAKRTETMTMEYANNKLELVPSDTNNVNKQSKTTKNNDNNADGTKGLYDACNDGTTLGVQEDNNDTDKENDDEDNTDSDTGEDLYDVNEDMN